MNMRWVLLILAPSLYPLYPAVALADPCAGTAGLGAGPVQAPLLDGQHGMGRRVCPRTEVGVGGGGLLLIDTPDFYGQIRAAAEVWGSFTVGEDTELFGFIEVYRYQTVLASVSASNGGIGHTSLGATHRFLSLDTLALGATGRIVLPTAVELYEHSWPIRTDLGVMAEYRPFDWLAFHGQAGFLFSAAITRADPQPRFGLVLTAGAAWQPGWRFALLADMHASFGYTDAVDVITAGGAARLAIIAGLALSIEAAFPIAGRERALGAVALRLIWQPSPGLETHGSK